MSGRIRTVKPEWLDDEVLAAASDEARVLSIALVLMADDYGRGRAALATIAAGAWRYQMERDDGAHAPEVLARASRALRELAAMRFVILYEVDRQRYFAIRTWKTHQKVDRPSKPRIPAPPVTESQDNQEAREDASEDSRDPREGPSSSSPPIPPTSDLRPPTGTTDRSAHATDAARGLGVHQPPKDRRALMEALAREHSARVKLATGKPGLSPSACEAIGRGAPAPSHRKVSDHLEAIAEWLEQDGDPDPLALFKRVLEGAARDAWMVANGYPLGSIAPNPAKYLAAPKSKRDGFQPPADHSQFTDSEVTPESFKLEAS